MIPDALNTVTQSRKPSVCVCGGGGGGGGGRMYPQPSLM